MEVLRSYLILLRRSVSNPFLFLPWTCWGLAETWNEWFRCWSGTVGENYAMSLLDEREISDG